MDEKMIEDMRGVVKGAIKHIPTPREKIRVLDGILKYTQGSILTATLVDVRAEVVNGV